MQKKAQTHSFAPIVIRMFSAFKYCIIAIFDQLNREALFFQNNAEVTLAFFFKTQVVKLMDIKTLLINPLTAEWALRALIDFTLSNAKRFYSSMGNPLDGKGLTTSKTMSPLTP